MKKKNIESYNVAKAKQVNTAGLVCSIISLVSEVVIFFMGVISIIGLYKDQGGSNDSTGMSSGTAFILIFGTIIVGVFGITFFILYSKHIKAIKNNKKLINHLKVNKNIFGMWLGNFISAILILVCVGLMAFVIPLIFGSDFALILTWSAILSYAIVIFSLFSVAFSIVTIIYTIKNNKLLKE